MNRMSYLSRRQLVTALVVPPVVTFGSISADALSADSHLIHLGLQFDKVAAEIDYAIDHPTTEVTDESLERLGRIQGEILATESKTVEGMRVKARAACWALLGDLDDPSEWTTNNRMALSIVRDLIRLYDSHLENPGALKKLVAEMERMGRRV